MADVDSEFRIRLKTVADNTGVDETVDGLKQIQVATEETGESVSKSLDKATESTHSLMGEQLGSLRSAHHLFTGVKEISEGGTAAVAGLAAEARIAAEVFESALGPAAPFVVILSTLLAGGISVFLKGLRGKTQKNKKKG